MGWFKQYFTEIATIAALFLTALYTFLQILQWRKHGDDYLPLTAVILVTLLLWVLLVIAAIRNWRDARRAAVKQLQYETLSAYNNKLVERIANYDTTIEQMTREHNGEIETLEYQHAKDIRNARTVVINSARWGIGGPYSHDATTRLQFLILRVEGLTATPDYLGDAGHPGEPKFLEVRFFCPCSPEEKRYTFKEGDAIDFEPLCR